MAAFLKCGDLGQNWSVNLELREGQQLVTHGVYQFVRHPMYASIWLWTIAQGLLLQNWFAGWSVVPACEQAVAHAS